MRTQPRVPLEPRKTPIQTRSADTVASISEATIQVLLSVGLDRLTTTRVADRAGVSVGTLYQYFPNKHSMLFAVLEQHLNRVADAVERACRHNHGEQVSTMVDAVVRAFVDAKMERADISMALYAVATGREEIALVRKVGQRAQRALISMLSTASRTLRRPRAYEPLGLCRHGRCDASDSRSRRAPAAKDGALGATAARPALPRLPDECRWPSLKAHRLESQSRQPTSITASGGVAQRTPRRLP